MEQFLVVVGDPIGGLEFVGPFDDEQSALDWATEHAEDDADWWVAALETPYEVAHPAAVIQ